MVKHSSSSRVVAEVMKVYEERPLKNDTLFSAIKFAVHNNVPNAFFISDDEGGDE